jgi:hypothetical protein
MERSVHVVAERELNPKLRMEEEEYASESGRGWSERREQRHYNNWHVKLDRNYE